MTREDKFFEAIIPLINDEREKVDDEYMNKVVEAMNLYVDAFIKPQLKGKIELCPIAFTTEEDEHPKEKTFGEFFPNLCKIKVYTSKLRDATNQEERNLLLTRFFLTASHETRHYLQWLYQQKLEDYSDFEQLGFLRKLLGRDAEELAGAYDILGNKNKYANVKALKDFLETTGKVNLIKSLLSPISFQANNSSIQYITRPIETDARKAGRKAGKRLIEGFNGYVKKLYPSLNFPKNFEAVSAIKAERFVRYGQEGLSTTDEEMMLPKYRFYIKEREREVDKIKTALIERESIENTVENAEGKDENADKLNQTRKTFYALCETVISAIHEEDNIALLDKEIKSLINKMKKVKISDLVAYTLELENRDKSSKQYVFKPNKQYVFSEIFDECLEYASEEFKNLDKLKALSKTFEEKGLDYAKEIVDITIKQLFPEIEEQEFFNDIKNKKVGVDELVAFVEKLEREEKSPNRGRLFGMAFRLCLEVMPEVYKKEDTLIQLSERLHKDWNLAWAWLYVKSKHSELYPESEDSSSI